MIVLKIVFQTLVLYQITQVITESKLSKPLRDYISRFDNIVCRFVYSLLSCFLCTSIWVGFILTFFLFNLAEYLGYVNQSWFWNGLFFSCLAWLIRVLEGAIDN